MFNTWIIYLSKQKTRLSSQGRTKDFRHKQQDSTELNGDGNRDRVGYGEDLTGDKEMFQSP